MGIIICDVHGAQDFVECCTHIYEEYEKGIVPAMFDVPTINLKVCQACYLNCEFYSLPNLTPDDLVKLTDEEGQALEEQLWSQYNAIERRIICVKCLDELRDK